MGIDMEWRPTFTAWTKARVSILQIALKDHVYLLDLPQLVKESESPGRELEFAQFIQSLFSNRTITKLGILNRMGYDEPVQILFHFFIFS